MILRRRGNAQRGEPSTDPRDILELYTGAMQPFMDVRADFTRSQQAEFDDVRCKLARATTNLRLVKKVVGALPQPAQIRSYDYNGDAYWTGDVQEAKLILGHSYWRRDNSTYLIGEKPGNKPKWSEALFMPVGILKDPFTVTANRSRFQALKEKGVQNTINGLPLESYLDESSQQLVVTGKSVGALVVGSSVEKKTFTNVTTGETEFTPLPSVGIPDETMEAFNIDWHLCNLAVEFGVTSTLRDAYQQAGRKL